jgi:hypothetical protein
MHLTLPSVWSLPGTLEENKNHNSAKTRQRPKFFPKLTPGQPLVATGKLSEKLIVRTIQKHT